MLDLREVLANFDEIQRRLALRGPGIDLEPVRELGERRRRLLTEVQELRTEQKQANERMRVLAKEGGEALARAREELRQLSDRIKALEEEARKVESELENALLFVPNLPSEQTPFGRSDADNPVVRVWGEKPVFDFEPRPHDEIAQALGILDMERAAKISGARFSVLRGLGAKLERALISFMLDLHARKGYEEVSPPYLVNRASMTGTGQLPKFEEDAFKTAEAEPDDEKFLVPTAEVPLTNLYREEVIEPGALPIKLCAYTPCFRREAGSYGRDTRGLIRQHQFHKVELVQFVEPERSMQALEELTADAEEVLRQLGLHYRVVELCTGDLGFAAARTYDLEVWLPGQNAYREISSCSNFGDYQARRAQIRYRPAPGEKPRLLHTLNGSGLAVGRTLVAILEQYQRADGSVEIPQVLRPYLGGIEEIRAA